MFEYISAIRYQSILFMSGKLQAGAVMFAVVLYYFCLLYFVDQPCFPFGVTDILEDLWKALLKKVLKAGKSG
jgi:hypothetical protein